MYIRSECARHYVLLYCSWCLLNICSAGMGCFWGAERKFWQHAGVVSTQVLLLLLLLLFFLLKKFLCC